MNKNLFEDKIKPILQYVGIIGASLASIVYIIVVIVLIQGFKYQQPIQGIIFALINAIVGFVIMQFLKIQGIDFAKSIPENKVIREQYFASRTKDKKVHSLKYYWFLSLIKDIAFKCSGVAIVTTGLIYVVIQGSQDYVLLLMALANLILFICFGLLALNSAYSFYNEYQIPYMLERLEEIKIKEK